MDAESSKRSKSRADLSLRKAGVTHQALLLLIVFII